MSGIIFCDSGISTSQKSYVKTLDIGYGNHDENGHGSALIRTIHTIEPNINIWSIKILDNNNLGTLEGVITALHECKNIDAKVICLALSIESERDEFNQLLDIIQILTDKKKIVVAALYNGKEFSLPAGYKNVIGVKCNDRLKYRMSYFKKERAIQCDLPIEAFYCEGLDDKLYRVNGNSIACAFMACHIAVIFGKYNLVSLDELEKKLEKELSYELEYYKFFNNNIYYSNDINLIRNKILEINRTITYLSDDGEIFRNIKTMTQLNNYITILKNEGFLINKNTFLRIYDLLNIDTLVNYFYIQQHTLL